MGLNNLTPEPVTIADRLFQELRRAILEGELPPGKKSANRNWLTNIMSVVAHCARRLAN